MSAFGTFVFEKFIHVRTLHLVDFDNLSWMDGRLSAYLKHNAPSTGLVIEKTESKIDLTVRAYLKINTHMHTMVYACRVPMDAMSTSCSRLNTVANVPTVTGN